MDQCSEASSPVRDSVGGSWLVEEYGLEIVQPLRYISKIGSSSLRREVDGRYFNTYQASYAPPNNLAGHLEFLLKHERIHLELLARLFAVVGPKEITDWVLSAPTGRYSRRCAWLYEWLTGESLDVPDTKAGPYVEILEPEKYWTAPDAEVEPRFRIRNNLPGTREFCPMVNFSTSVAPSIGEAEVKEALIQLEAQFGADLIRRAAIWLTVKESRSSFKIEGENDPSREDRFAAAMEANIGKVSDLYGDSLEPLQREVLGPNALHYGIRKSPIFVGQTFRMREIVHYIGPHYKDLPSLMSGLAATAVRTQGANPILRSAVLSFAFVYIHPLCDGNGRISRFIINDTLRRGGLTHDPTIIPVSAAISRDMASYDRVLDVFSAALRRTYSGLWRFGIDRKYSDGETSNFEFDGYDKALPAWRYIDLTDHVVYIAKALEAAVRKEMTEEADYLRKHYEIRARLGQIIQGSDNSLDRIIRSVTQNGGNISGKLAAEYPIFEDEALSEAVCRAVMADSAPSED